MEGVLDFILSVGKKVSFAAATLAVRALAVGAFAVLAITAVVASFV